MTDHHEPPTSSQYGLAIAAVDRVRRYRWLRVFTAVFSIAIIVLVSIGFVRIQHNSDRIDRLVAANCAATQANRTAIRSFAQTAATYTPIPDNTDPVDRDRIEASRAARLAAIEQFLKDYPPVRCPKI